MRSEYLRRSESPAEAGASACHSSDAAAMGWLCRLCRVGNASAMSYVILRRTNARLAFECCELWCGARSSSVIGRLTRRGGRRCWNLASTASLASGHLSWRRGGCTLAFLMEGVERSRGKGGGVDIVGDVLPAQWSVSAAASAVQPPVLGRHPAHPLPSPARIPISESCPHPFFGRSHHHPRWR